MWKGHCFLVVFRSLIFQHQAAHLQLTDECTVRQKLCSKVKLRDEPNKVMLSCGVSRGMFFLFFVGNVGHDPFKSETLDFLM